MLRSGGTASANKTSYELDGVRYPRLTRILSILNEPGKVHADPKTVAQAMRVGTAVHTHIARSLRKGVPLLLPKDASADVRGAWKGWCWWYDMQPKPFEPVHIEEPAISPALGYGCTPDVVLAQELIEWKVASSIRPAYWIQLHAQVPCVWPTPGPVQVRVVRLDKHLCDFEDVRQPYNPEIAATFLKLKDVYLAWYGQEINDADQPTGGEG